MMLAPTLVTAALITERCLEGGGAARGQVCHFGCVCVMLGLSVACLQLIACCYNRKCVHWHSFCSSHEHTVAQVAFVSVLSVLPHEVWSKHSVQ